MINSLEQLELKANLTPQERAYFDKLKVEYIELYDGRTLDQVVVEKDVVALQQIERKIEEMKDFLEKREMGVDMDKRNREDFFGWIKKFHLEDKLTDEWIEKNIKFKDGCITINSGFYSYKKPIPYLPDNLHINGSLDLHDCAELINLPDNLHVVGYLDLQYCTGLTTLPDNLHVEEYLDLEGCTSITGLPDNLCVEGNVYVVGLSEEIKQRVYELKARGQIKGEIKNS